MPKVYNKHKDIIPAGAVYVGRPTKYGNPFSHMPNTQAEFRVSSRDEAVDSYESWIKNNSKLIAYAKLELKGKDLVCFCAPLRCHADVLLKLVNEEN